MEAIKSNELRIGNLVTYMNKHILSINGYIIKSIESNEIENIDCGYIPIPLTEEWLLKFGFEKLPRNYGQIDNCEFIKNELNIVLWDEGFFQIFKKNTYLIDIEYVHQLQNLYFALTGEELTIK